MSKKSLQHQQVMQKALSQDSAKAANGTREYAKEYEISNKVQPSFK